MQRQASLTSPPRLLETSAITKVKLDLADEQQSAVPPMLAHVQHIYVHATSYAQLKSLAPRLAELPPGCVLDLEISFCSGEDPDDLNMGTVKSIVCRASLAERLTAFEYTSREGW
ncbi:hypothetical protein WJX81_003348 [Elliptochloris bilobata]|uniref:Uncharacterized protein n=1 Tax=Elliptochloris bilobata TaxID=381761 RepID=A0AAW1SHK6_9CHLO